MDVSNEFWGLSANGWSAVANLAMVALTAVLVGVAWYQLHALREENKKSRTLQACERYDTDPVLDACLRNLAIGHNSGDLLTNPEKYRIDCATLLNYLETLCAGIESEIYDDKIVRAFHEETIRDQFADYIESGLITKMKIVGEYDSLARIREKWKVARR